MIAKFEYKELVKRLEKVMNEEIKKIDFYKEVEQCYNGFEDNYFVCLQNENEDYQFKIIDKFQESNLVTYLKVKNNFDTIQVLEYKFENLKLATYKATKVSPEFTRSPLNYEWNEFEYMYPNIVLFGNRNFSDYGDAEIIENIENLYSDLHWFYKGVREFENVNDIYEYHLQESPTRQQKKLIWNTFKNNKTTAETLPKIISILKNEEYDLATLSGYCQGDWIHCLYPKKHETLIDRLELEYFNLGTEWTIIDEFEECMYEYTDFDDIEELASYLGTTIDDIIFKEN